MQQKLHAKFVCRPQFLQMASSSTSRTSPVKFVHKDYAYHLLILNCSFSVHVPVQSNFVHCSRTVVRREAKYNEEELFLQRSRRTALLERCKTQAYVISPCHVTFKIPDEQDWNGDWNTGADHRLVELWIKNDNIKMGMESSGTGLGQKHSTLSSTRTFRVIFNNEKKKKRAKRSKPLQLYFN